MEQNSLRLKVVRLAQRSRRAIRLYTSVYNSISATSMIDPSPTLNTLAVGSPIIQSQSQEGRFQGDRSQLDRSQLDRSLGSRSNSDQIQSGSIHSIRRDPRAADIFHPSSSSCFSSQLSSPQFTYANDFISNDFISNQLNTSNESHTLGNIAVAALSTRTATGKGYRTSGERFSEIQAAEWRDVNLSLLKALTSALEEPRQRDLPKRILSIRDAFGEQWSTLNARLQTNRAEAIAAAERADFINLAVLSESLVSLKARCQASEAAHHELSEVCKGLSTSNDRAPSKTTVENQLTTSTVKRTQLSAGYEQQPIFKVVKSSSSGNR